MEINKEERVQLARDYFRKGYACSQAVVLAFQDLVGLDADVLARLSVGLGAGVGRMREVCGAVSGMAMVAGSVVGDSGDIAGHKRDTYALVQNLASKFRDRNGSIVCRELLGLRAEAKSCSHQSESSPLPEAGSDSISAGPQTEAGICSISTGSQPETRTPEYYKTRPCEEMVACAAGLLAEYLSATQLL